MSALHLLLDPSHNTSATSPPAAGRPLQSYVSDRADVEPDILQRVADLSLSPVLAPSPDDEDESHSSSASDPASSFVSLPTSPFSGAGSITSFDYGGNPDDVISDSELSLSPAPSLYSLTDSLREQSIRLEYGRGVNTHSEIYKIAADEEEAERLNRQHRIYQELMGGYAPPLKEVLTGAGNSSKACLDIGCGSGAWILDIAREFPDVSCTAVDLAPLPAMTRIPPNLRFEIDDVNLGLEHFAGDFDVVHVRLVSTGIKDYYRLIDDAAMALRPRGLADFTECDFRVYDSKRRLIVPTTQEVWGKFDPPEGWIGTGMARCGGSSAVRGPKAHANALTSAPSPFLARYATLAGQAVRKRGGHVDAAALLHRWISEHRAYEDVVYREFWMPAAPWMGDKEVQKLPEFNRLSNEELENMCRIGNELGKNIIDFMRSARPLLLSTGVPEPVVNYLEDGTAREIKEARIPMYFRVQNVYARKKGETLFPEPTPEPGGERT